ncbi:hypothetical protein [Cylindrospermopsis raciborskii]|uniref:hypothetical protein n=1 Tax=Cylindrospermopsis raciborskii TaxID=77022 RepID=UPI0011AEDCD7|nr:hypothetical protein [Cylindrospermopsis raciborskii]
MQNFLVRNTGFVEYLRGVGKCDRLYEWGCRSEYQILVVEKRPYMGTQIPMMKIYHCQVK